MSACRHRVRVGTGWPGVSIQTYQRLSVVLVPACQAPIIGAVLELVGPGSVYRNTSDPESVVQCLPRQAPVVIWFVLEQVGLGSVYCEWVRWKV